jgi:glutaminyl-peptide cyclotransferase
MKTISKVFFFILIAVSFTFTACRNSNSSSSIVDTTSQVLKVHVPSFDADSTYDWIAKQVSFGPRIPGTPAQDKCANWIISKLKNYTGNVIEQNVQVKIYNGKMIPCHNIIASFNPQVQKRILLLTHWDTRPWSDEDSAHPRQPFDGADDGGSGVAVLLELAAQFSKQVPAVGIDLLFVDVEDYGTPSFENPGANSDATYCLGTQYWAQHTQTPNYRAYYGILLDMVGARGATFLQEGSSMNYAPSIVKKVWDAANNIGYSSNFLYQNAPGGIVDDHTFVNQMNGTPTIDIIYLTPNTKSGFAPHWHTQNDNMKIIDKSTLKAVGQTLLQVLYTEPANVSS